MLCITKFQNNLLKQKFLLCINYKCAKEVLHKDENNALK
jgi:hypothetical protein